MNFLSSFRKRLFWSVDFLKGGRIKEHYEDIKLINGNIKVHSTNALYHAHLLRLLKQAHQTTTFYSNIDLSDNLNDFPVINKNIVRNNYDDFKSSTFLNRKNTPVFTGGSTGAPFKLFHDTDKRNRHTADNIYYAENGGYTLGDRLYLLRAWHSKEKKSLLFIKKNVKPYGIVNYTNADMKKLLTDLKNDPTEKCIVCFASMCDILVNYLDSIKSPLLVGLNIKSIITDGDTLTSTTKKKMENYFQTPTIARYGNMECGIMGQQPYSGGNHYELNWSSYYFELLDIEKDKPVKPGELGRIVVTDLFNYCMPLIRYDTGDLASFSKKYNTLEEAKVFDKIEGRKVDLIYDTKNRAISPYMIVQKMMEQVELKQFQFVQKGKKEYTFKLNPWSKFTKENELIRDSKTYLGEDADISIEYVEEVPLLSSGKRKQVVNEM